MAFRHILHEDRVKAVQEYIETKKLKETAEKYGISEATILNDYKYILWEVDETLKKNVLKTVKRTLKKLYHFVVRK